MSRSPMQILLELLRAWAGVPSASLNSTDKSHFMAVIKLAGDQAVLPLLHDGLHNLIAQGRAPGWDALTPMLKVFTEQNSARNREVREVCATLGQILRSQSIEPVFLKGAAWILEDESAAPWRLVSDIDVLVGEGEVVAAARLLAENGFTQMGDPATYSSEVHHHHPALADPAGKWAVEIHTRLMRETGLHDNLLGSIPGNVTVGEETSSVFHLPDNTTRLIHLIAHAQISNLGYALRSISLRDMAEAALLLQRPDIDLARLEHRFKAAGQQKQLNSFLAALELVTGRQVNASHISGRARRWATMAFDELHTPPAAALRNTRLGLHYIRTLLVNPRRIAGSARAFAGTRRSSHAWRILGRRTGRKD